MIKKTCLNVLLIVLATACDAGTVEKQSAGASELQPLVFEPVEVTKNVYTVIGALTPPNYENGGLNNNLSFIVTDEGVLVFNAGDNSRLAEALHRAIRQVTDQPVKWVVNENGQGHAWLGNGYYRQLPGVQIVAQEAAYRVMEAEGESLLKTMQARMKDRAEGTVLALPDVTFSDTHVIEMGGLSFHSIWFGPGHSPGDIALWVPEIKLLITGDYGFHQRLLGIFPYTLSKGWLASYEKMAALAPEFVIPGHGEATTLSELDEWTKGYLVFLRSESERILEEGGALADALAVVDQSKYAHLVNYDVLARKNLSRIFLEVESEFFE